MYNYYNITQSVYRHLKDLLAASGIGSGGFSGTLTFSPTDVDLLKRVVAYSDYTGDEKEIVLPLIVLDDGSSFYSPYEMGTVDLQHKMVFGITIYAQNISQLHELTDQVIFDIHRPIDLKDYKSNPTAPDIVGTLYVDGINVLRGRSEIDYSPLQNYKEILFTVSDK